MHEVKTSGAGSQEYIHSKRAGVQCDAYTQ